MLTIPRTVNEIVDSMPKTPEEISISSKIKEIHDNIESEFVKLFVDDGLDATNVFFDSERAEINNVTIYWENKDILDFLKTSSEKKFAINCPCFGRFLPSDTKPVLTYRTVVKLFDTSFQEKVKALFEKYISERKPLIDRKIEIGLERVEKAKKIAAEELATRLQEEETYCRRKPYAYVYSQSGFQDSSECHWTYRGRPVMISMFLDSPNDIPECEPGKKIVETRLLKKIK